MGVTRPVDRGGQVVLTPSSLDKGTCIRPVLSTKDVVFQTASCIPLFGRTCGTRATTDQYVVIFMKGRPPAWVLESIVENAGLSFGKKKKQPFRCHIVNEALDAILRSNTTSTVSSRYMYFLFKLLLLGMIHIQPPTRYFP